MDIGEGATKAAPASSAHIRNAGSHFRGGFRFGPGRLAKRPQTQVQRLRLLVSDDIRLRLERPVAQGL